MTIELPALPVLTLEHDFTFDNDTVSTCESVSAFEVADLGGRLVSWDSQHQTLKLLSETVSTESQYDKRIILERLGTVCCQKLRKLFFLLLSLLLNRKFFLFFFLK